MCVRRYGMAARYFAATGVCVRESEAEREREGQCACVCPTMERLHTTLMLLVFV